MILKPADEGDLFLEGAHLISSVWETPSPFTSSRNLFSKAQRRGIGALWTFTLSVAFAAFFDSLIFHFSRDVMKYRFDLSAILLLRLDTLCLQFSSVVIWNANMSGWLPVFNVLCREDAETERVKVRGKRHDLNGFVASDWEPTRSGRSKSGRNRGWFAIKRTESTLLYSVDTNKIHIAKLPDIHWNSYATKVTLILALIPSGRAFIFPGKLLFRLVVCIPSSFGVVHVFLNSLIQSKRREHTIGSGPCGRSGK